MWKPKEEEKVQINDDEKVETEWDEVLAGATEEELVDLAGELMSFGYCDKQTPFLMLNVSHCDLLLGNIQNGTVFVSWSMLHPVIGAKKMWLVY